MVSGHGPIGAQFPVATLKATDWAACFLSYSGCNWLNQNNALADFTPIAQGLSHNQIATEQALWFRILPNLFLLTHNMTLQRLFDAFKWMQKSASCLVTCLALTLQSPPLHSFIYWHDTIVCLYTCPASVIGKDRVLNELPFMSSTGRCPLPIKKSSLIKRSAILIHVIKLDLVFLHRTKLGSPVQLLDVHQWQFKGDYAQKNYL